MNPLAWVVNSLRTHPEPASFPEELAENATLIELAEARSRLSVIARVTTDLRRQVDGELAKRLEGKALRYGEDIMRPAWSGSAKVTDPERWWLYVVEALEKLPADAKAGLLQALYPANAVRITALKWLAEIQEVSEKTIRWTFIHHDPPTSPLKVEPRSKAPKYLQSLKEGEVR